MMDIKRRLSRLLGGPLRSPSQEEVATAMRTLFGICPACHKNMAGHSYFKVASVFLDDLHQNEDLADLIRRGKWQQAVEFQDWQAERDERQYFAIRCPHRTEFLLFKVVSRSEMLLDDFAESHESLDPASSLTLAQIAGNRWQKM